MIRARGASGAVSLRLLALASRLLLLAEMLLMTSCLRRLALSLSAVVVLAPSSFAIVRHEPELTPEAATRLQGAPFVQPSVDWNESKQWGASDPAFRSFVNEAGAEWHPRWDRRTGRLSFAWGTFPAWLPADARVSSQEDVAATLKTLDVQCRALLARHADLFRLPVSDGALTLDTLRSVPIDGGRVWIVSYGVSVDGVPVEGASVFFRLNSGRLVQMGEEGLSDDLASATTKPRVDAATAEELGAHEAASLFGDKAIATSIAPPRLALLPWSDSPRVFTGTPGTGLQYKLAWRTTQRVAGRLETWAAWHDAVSGERLALWDDNKYACAPASTPQGRVVGGVYLGAIEEVPETLRGMPYARVQNGTQKDADGNGIFPFATGQGATTTLSGAYFDMNCDTCTNPPQAIATSIAPGYLSLRTGGVDATGNGFSTKAERNCFYHLNIIRDIASKHLSDAQAGGYFSRTTPATVNINFTCNAFWDGNGVNFFRSGGGCNNTGEIADVMQHEWGHGLDQYTGGGSDGARGEGIGDTVAFLATHDPRLGPYFVVGDANGIRNADENVAGLYSVATIDTYCDPVGGGGDGPLGFEVHCESGIFTQAWWHLSVNLRNKMVAAGGSEAAGWYLTEKLFFQSLPGSRTYLPTGTQPTYDAVMLVDDDNGDLTDGTPNATEINDAFSHHGIAGSPLVGDSADCVAPPAPGITLSSAQSPTDGLWQIHVSWTPVPGAAEYRVFRNQAGGAGADEQVAVVTAPTTDFFDDDVTDGVTFYYRVTAFLPNGCTSIVDNRQQVDVGVLPAITLDSWSFDDSAQNGNGFADPGETLVIPITAFNGGSAQATAVLATLSSPDPGVTIVRGSQNLGDMAAGTTASTAAPHFAITLSPSVPCGSTIPFAVSFEATEGCSASGFMLQVGDPPNPCDAPDPRPRLRYESYSISDGLAGGGTGDASGTAEPGEIVRLPIDLTNYGNAQATNIRGTLSLVSGPPGTLVSDATTPWLDMAPGLRLTSGGAPAHVEVTVPADAPCGSTINLHLDVTYDGPAGSYAIAQDLSLLVGHVVTNTAYTDDFEGGDNGFTHGADCTRPGCDDWQHGPPTNASPSDPTVAHSGANVWGNDLGTLVAQGSNGNYRGNTISWLMSPPIDCSALTGTKLSYWRWLTVEQGQYDQARVQVAIVPNPQDADFITIWQNPDVGDTLDTAWTYMEHDISSLADGVPFVTIRFQLQSDGGLEYGGWTLDDFQVSSSRIVCSNCLAIGPPSSPGAGLRATGVKSQTSAEFEWSRSGVLQSGEEWKLYRGTVANDVSTEITTSPMTASIFLDDNAPNALYFYNLVKTNCLGIETP